MKHFETCLDRAIDINEILNIVPGVNFHAHIGLGYEKSFYHELSDCDNESLYIPAVHILSVKSAIPMIAYEDVVDPFPKNLSPCGRSHVCVHGAAACTYRGVHCTCRGGYGRKKNNVDKDDLHGPDDASQISQN